MAVDPEPVFDGGRPLAGKTVVVTRPRDQAASLARPLEDLGADVLLAPTARIVPRPLDEEVIGVVGELSDYELVVFTSVNGVEAFLGYLAELAVPLVSLAGAAVAAVGPATAAALARRGVPCDVMGEEYLAEGLLEALERRASTLAGARVLLPCARIARPVLPDALRGLGARVDVLPVYDTLPVQALDVPLERIEQADFITFTSSSTARYFVALMEAAGPADGAVRAGSAGGVRIRAGRPLVERLSHVALCSIGPVTSGTLRELGLTVAVEASTATVLGLAEAIAAFSRRHASDG